MRLHADSHLDHGLTPNQLAHILVLFQDRASFFIETITLPEDLGRGPEQRARYRAEVLR